MEDPQTAEIWREPPELTQALPRAARLKGIQKKVLWWVCTGFALPALLFLVISFFVSHKMENLKDNGISTYGVIDRLHRDGKQSNPTYVADYTFYNRPGRQVGGPISHGTSPLESSDFAALNVGAEVEVIFLPGRPEISALQISLNTIWADPWTQFYHLSYMIIGIFGSVIIFILTSSCIVFLRENNLAKWGTACPALIVSEKEVSGRFGKKIHVIYQFQVEGRIFQGKRKDLPNTKELSRPAFASFNAKIRANPTVLYDPNHPSRNLLYPPAMLQFGETSG